MASPDAGRRRLVVNADDFGRSRAINQAVIRAHREGILTTALAAKSYLHEHVSGLRWAGVAMIVLGAALVSWSERAKAPPPPARAPALLPRS
jgi:hypothetical protein